MSRGIFLPRPEAVDFLAHPAPARGCLSTSSGPLFGGEASDQGCPRIFAAEKESADGGLKSGVRTAIAVAIAAAYVILGIMLLVADPLTHFLWIAASLFLVFYLIRVISDYPLALAFGFTMAVSIPLWDEAYLTLNERTGNTLWLAFAVIIGSAVTVVVEYVFRRVHPITDLTTGIESRLAAVEDLLRQNPANPPISRTVEKDLTFYSALGGLQATKTTASLRLSAAIHRAHECRHVTAGPADRPCRQHGSSAFLAAHQCFAGRSRATLTPGKSDC